MREVAQVQGSSARVSVLQGEVVEVVEQLVPGRVEVEYMIQDIGVNVDMLVMPSPGGEFLTSMLLTNMKYVASFLEVAPGHTRQAL